ncbi:hypothetical protein [Allomesorhizobium alhagi]|uniref:Uncharacterized protein n=1 Tax=Mesorhizobium alhagi CCNWXJ12-2 TaxID=1107882 RepID=H0HQV1_9HYPH|nr:hypothetical protein [Mesorhizobium alhagi]EHK56915.1 hypothetical protein MAXJ12_12657 [Mesorhizobium alhagi CCNWXJ12-2]
MDANFDLLGDPIPEGWGKRGRPQHIPTEQNRNKVMMLLAFGWNNERIAKALSITPPTLRKNYFRELKFRDEARDRVEGNLASMLWEFAKAGNVAAAKEFRKLMERNDLMGQHLAAHHVGAEKAKKEQKLGKKERAQLEAQTPNTDTPLGELMAQRAAAADKLN